MQPLQSPSPIMVLMQSADMPRPEVAHKWAAVRTTLEQVMHWNLRGMLALPWGGLPTNSMTINIYYSVNSEFQNEQKLQCSEQNAIMC